MVTKKLFEEALAAEGITGKLADVARSVFQQESGSGKNTKTSNAGAVGGMQIIPGTFKEVADKGWDINDPLQNARAGIRYLAKMDKLAGGDPVLTAAGYYGGPGGLAKAKLGIAVSDPRNPNAPTTLQYGQQVASRLGKSAPPMPSNAPTASVPTMVATTPTAVVNNVPEEVLAQVPVQGPSYGPDPWAQFNQAMPTEVAPTVASMQYGIKPMRVPNFLDMVQYEQETQVPMFKPFGLRGRG